MGASARVLDVIGRALIAWTGLWLLLGVFVFTGSAVVNPDDFLSDQASLAVEAVGYLWVAIIVIALVVAVWDGLIRGAGGRWTAIACVGVYALGLLTVLIDPDSDNDFGEFAGIGLFSLGPGMLGGLLRVWARSAARSAEAAG
jgi:hypothetical protein